MWHNCFYWNWWRVWKDRFSTYPSLFNALIHFFPFSSSPSTPHWTIQLIVFAVISSFISSHSTHTHTLSLFSLSHTLWNCHTIFFLLSIGYLRHSHHSHSIFTVLKVLLPSIYHFYSIHCLLHHFYITIHPHVTFLYHDSFSITYLPYTFHVSSFYIHAFTFTSSFILHLLIVFHFFSSSNLTHLFTSSPSLPTFPSSFNKQRVLELF